MGHRIWRVEIAIAPGGSAVEIVQYDPRYRDAFIEYNTDWIEEYFGHLEEEDYETFAHIDDEIREGGMIYFAIEEDTVLAACMTKPMSGITWEICKLCSNKHREHSGSGSAVFAAAMQWAEDHGAKRLFIISNSQLKPAIHIYEKYGFKELKLGDYGYERGDIAYEKILS